jgi:hypothetical protein
MNLSGKSIKKLNYFLIFFCLALLLPAIFVSIRSSVDPYHEGALFPSAIGVAHGKAIFREVNNQYGFVIALIHSPFIALFGNHLIIYRLVGYLVYLLAVLFFFLIIKKIANNVTATFCSLILITINPAWSFLAQNNISGLSVWVNTYGILFTLISVFLVLRVLENPNMNLKVYAAASALSLVAMFVRLEFAFVWMSQFLFLTYKFKKNPIRKSPAANWFLGGFITFILATAYLFKTGALNDSFQQLIKVWFDSPPNSAHLGLGNLLTFSVSCLLFIVCFYLVYIVLRLSGSKTISILLVLFLIKVLTGISESLTNFSLLGKRVGPYIATAVQGLLLNYCSVLVLCLIIVAIGSCLSKFNLLGRTNFPNSGITTNFLFVTSLGTLPQLHNINSAYIFMIIPVILVWFVSYISINAVFLSLNKRQLFASVYVTLSIFIGVSVFCSLNLANKPQYPYKSYILQGLNDTNRIERDKIDSNLRVLEMYVKNGQMFMDCQYGLYSVSPTGMYVANKWTWSEIPSAWRLNSLHDAKPGNFLLRCGGGNNTQTQYSNWSRSLTVSLIQENENFLLYRINKPLFIQ